MGWDYSNSRAGAVHSHGSIAGLRSNHMQYTLTLNTRMLALAGFCLFSLFVLLLLLGIEIGKKMATPEVAPVSPTLSSGHAAPTESPVKLNPDYAK